MFYLITNCGEVYLDAVTSVEMGSAAVYLLLPLSPPAVLLQITPLIRVQLLTHQGGLSLVDTNSRSVVLSMEVCVFGACVRTGP